MVIKRPNFLTSLLVTAGLITLSCSMAGEIIGSLNPTSTPAVTAETALNPTPNQPAPTLSPPTASPTMEPIELPAPTVSPPTATSTIESAPLQPSATATQEGALTGVTFFDYDGDGLQGEQEPGIAAVWVCIYLPQGDRCALSETDGRYVLEGLPPGQHKVYVFSPTDDPAGAFRFVNVFTGWAEVPGYQVGDSWVQWSELPGTELQHIDEPLVVDVQPVTSLDIALVQGYLTDIFACGDRERVQTFQAYDLDPRDGYVRNYHEGESRTIQRGAAVLTGDNHLAIDWGDLNQYIIGMPLYAPANGVVVFAGIDETANGDCLVVNLVHPETGGSSGILHLEKVLVRERQEVRRGQLLGTLGQSCATWPHVHFFLRPGDLQVDGQWEGIDPYRDTADPDSFSYWTVDNEPQCPTYVEK